ncbi:T9SS type A sorting domain-containing protein [Parvicella tangerina]|uniref:T9SS C-terminal target domain-containing protein n=1 Tax=Parvicella tangerina TaxID=2829795 RepID=A0A916JP71_9FLAO|nr:T9SS type A sorting domain-containing protein [Parvicella tangerina]CAG5085271.1 hypothetical protein CRYO30217_02707 [Parvicella tangerina]
MKRILLPILAVAAVVQINAQITYHDYAPDEEIHATYAGESISIDFDNDQNPELLIYGTKHDTTFSGFPVTLTGFAMTTYGNTEVLGRTTTVGTETVLEADSLLPGFTIDGSSTYVNSSTPSVFPGVGLNADASGFASVGQFAGAGEKYFGVKFDISGSTHYAWVKVEVSATHDTCVIDSYGYETSASTAIDAGDMGSGTVSVEESSFAADVVVQENSFRLEGMAQGEVTVFNVLGEIQLTRRITSDVIYLDNSSLSSGVYFIRCRKGMEVITFKVYKP